MSDGYCFAWGPEKLAQIDREWREAEGPPEPAPPMANVHLAVELSTGLDAIRDFHFQGCTLRLRPTPYPTAIRLLAWMQQKERLEAMGDLLAEHLPDLRDCYQEIADLAGGLVLELTGPNPFLDATPADFHRVLVFTLDAGDELPIRQHRRTGVTQRYNAAFYLYRYFEKFGSTPGMVVLEDGRPQPASWRHFCQALRYLARTGAEDGLQTFGAMASAQHGGDSAERWLEAQQEQIGTAD